MDLLGLEELGLEGRNMDAMSDLGSGFDDDDHWPGDDSDESDVDEDEAKRRLLPLRKAGKKPVVLLELSDIESMRDAHGPELDEVTLGDLMADMELTMEEAMTIGASKSGRRKKRSHVSPDVYLSAVLNTPTLFERIYSYIHHETAFIHRRVARSFRKRFTTLKVKTRVHHYLDRFLAYASALKTPLPRDFRFSIAGQATRDQLALLGRIIGKNLVPGLEDVAILTDSETDSRHFSSFFKACEAAPPDCQLRTFDFCGSYLGDDSIRGLLMAMRKGALPHLQALRLSRCNLSWVTVKCLADTMAGRTALTVTGPAGQDRAPRCDAVIELDLSRNQLTEGPAQLFPVHAMPTHYRTLARLDLSDTFLEPTDLPPLGEALRRQALRGLTHLRLANNDRVGDDAVAGLLAVLASQPKACPSLVQLDVSNTGGGIHMARALCSALHAGALAGLQQLDLSFNLLAHDGIDLFCEAIMQQTCPQLECLGLACNRLKDQGLHCLSRCLATGACSSLRELDISVNEVGGSMQNLARVVNGGACPALRVLKLRGNIFDVEASVTLFHPRVRRVVNIT